MSAAPDPNARIIPADGLSLAILTISCIFFGVALITVSLRTFTRLKRATFGIDDGFMVFGTVCSPRWLYVLFASSYPFILMIFADFAHQIVYTVATALAIYAVHVGMGRLVQDLNEWQQSEAMRYFIIWILTYVLALATVKSSICVTIMRIAATNICLRITVYVLLAITWASFFTTFIGTLLYCRPVRAIWTPQLILSGGGTCASVDTFVIIGHVATVTTIVTDLALVVVPAIMLWNTQMKKQEKLQAFGLLSFASVASIITMVRIPYVNKYEKMENLQFWVAHTMLCSNIETGIGCIAASVPSLRHFFRREQSVGSSGPSNKRSAPRPSTNIFSIGSQPRRFPPETGFSLTNGHTEAGDSCERLHDGSFSDRSDAITALRGKHDERTTVVDIEMKDMETDKRKVAH